MFFRRANPKQTTFDERLEDLRKAGFTVAPAQNGRYMVSRNGCAVILESGTGGAPRIAERAGLQMTGGIGKLVDEGFQKFFLAPNGSQKPALAPELKALHAFQEDLRELLGMESLYNESLGTVSTQYLYDRVKDRDRGVPKRPWE
jgi:hypothetical protein